MLLWWVESSGCEGLEDYFLSGTVCLERKSCDSSSNSHVYLEIFKSTIFSSQQ